MLQDCPKILYKYRFWNDVYHKKILTENEFFFASPNELNDPDDFKIPIDWSITEEEMEAFAQMMVDRHPNPPIGYKDSIIYKIKHDKTLQQESNNFLFEKDALDFGILSLCKEYFNQHMWDEYADKHTGFCVGINAESVFTLEIFWGNHMNYVDQLPSIKPMQTKLYGYKKAFTKYSKYSPEAEYHILNLEYNGFTQPDQRKYTIPNDAIVEIILGIHMPEDHKKQILAIAKSKVIKVYQLLDSLNYEKREIIE